MTKTENLVASDLEPFRLIDPPIELASATPQLVRALFDLVRYIGDRLRNNIRTLPVGVKDAPGIEMTISVSGDISNRTMIIIGPGGSTSNTHLVGLFQGAIFWDKRITVKHLEKLVASGKGSVKKIFHERNRIYEVLSDEDPEMVRRHFDHPEDLLIRRETGKATSFLCHRRDQAFFDYKEAIVKKILQREGLEDPKAIAELSRRRLTLLATEIDTEISKYYE